jgi:hypothetical protein
VLEKRLVIPTPPAWNSNQADVRQAFAVVASSCRWFEAPLGVAQVGSPWWVSGEKCDLPSCVDVDLMLLRPAVFAVVLVWTRRLVEDANAASVLPDTAAVALDEQSTGVVGLRLRRTIGFAQRRSGVFLLPAKASSDLLFIFGGFFIGVLGGADQVGLGGGMGALAATRRFAHFFT